MSNFQFHKVQEQLRAKQPLRSAIEGTTFPGYEHRAVNSVRRSTNPPGTDLTHLYLINLSNTWDDGTCVLVDISRLFPGHFHSW